MAASFRMRKASEYEEPFSPEVIVKDKRYVSAPKLDELDEGSDSKEGFVPLPEEPSSKREEPPHEYTYIDEKQLTDQAQFGYEYFDQEGEKLTSEVCNLW